MTGLYKTYFSLADRWAERHLFALAGALLLLGTLPFLTVIEGPLHSDVYLYHEVASDIRDGKVPYRDVQVAYPPYAIPIFFSPVVFGDEDYGVGFKLLVVIADSIIKWLLLGIGRRETKGLRSLFPLACYCLTLPSIRYFFLQRYDVFPALISLAALWLFCSGKYALSGLMLSVGIGMKLYPILFVPMLFILTSRERQSRRFLLGLVGGILPILILSFWLPWWNFLGLHEDRKLQVESLYASVIWLMHHFEVTQAEWVAGRGCLEVRGSLASMILPWSRAWLVLGVGISTILVCWSAVRSSRPSLPHLARLLLIPLLAFVVFNQVFSPQYMIWLLTLAAIGSLVGNPWITVAFPFTTMLTPVFYPSPEYNGGGLSQTQTMVLVGRNLILVIVWVFLVRECQRAVKTGHFESGVA